MTTTRFSPVGFRRDLSDCAQFSFRSRRLGNTSNPLVVSTPNYRLVAQSQRLTLRPTHAPLRFELVVGAVFVFILACGALWVLSIAGIGRSSTSPALWLVGGLLFGAVLLTVVIRHSAVARGLAIDLEAGTIQRNGKPIAASASVSQVVIAESWSADGTAFFKVALDVPYRKNFVVATEIERTDAERVGEAIALFLGLRLKSGRID